VAVVIENVEVVPSPPPQQPAGGGAAGGAAGEPAPSELERSAELARTLRKGAQRLSRVRAH
jgi:hypothetical protein